MDKTILKPPSLLLHSCCAPCSASVLEHLREQFFITVFFYNPNITERAEYEKRRDEQLRLLAIMNGSNGVIEGAYVSPGNAGILPAKHPISYLEGDHDSAAFEKMARGLENEPEGGLRCYHCYELRLGETARMAASGGFGCFTTTLSVSPKKKATKINEIGAAFPLYLPADFKKKDGFKRSMELSKAYELYRQNFCGCEYSRG